VVVTASRTPDLNNLVPMGVTVITSEEIFSSGAKHANEAIRWLGGVSGRLNTNGGRDQSLDLRGFGENSSSNQVILIDGVRQNEGDMDGNSLSWIPIDMIERIEIVRGSGAVLFGEGATAGTINVITKQDRLKDGGSVTYSIGNQNLSEQRFFLVKKIGEWNWLGSGINLSNDNHRDNFKASEEGGLIRGRWGDGPTRLMVQLASQGEKSGLPGGITLNDFNANPRISYKLQDSGKIQTDQMLFNAQSVMNDWQWSVDVNRRLKQIDSDYVADSYKTRNKNRTSRVGMRTWHDIEGPKFSQRFLVGLDYEDWDQDRDNVSSIVQGSRAVYARYETMLKKWQAKYFVGARNSSFTRVASGQVDGSVKDSSTSWETGLSKMIWKTYEVFFKMGSSYRLPNADEFMCYSIYDMCPAVVVNILRAQTSKDAEFGLKFKTNGTDFSARYYRHQLRDEIAMAPDYATNTNLDPTLRQGLEVELRHTLSQRVQLRSTFAQRKSEFAEGPYAGKKIPFSPDQTFTGRVTYRMDEQQQLSLAANWVAEQRISGDYDNSCSEQMPSYATWDARYMRNLKDWDFSATVLNLADRSYYSVRTRCNASLKSIYPEAGRTYVLSAQYKF
jgi:iron complex outermembrane receptor protein